MVSELSDRQLYFAFLNESGADVTLGDLQTSDAHVLVWVETDAGDL
jgi:hypothetical protein